MTKVGSEIRNPDFRLWFPDIDVSGHEARCRFDAVQVGAILLHQGTEATCLKFLDRLGIVTREVRDWHIERICTPFFTDLPDASDWRDRYRVSWRVTIRALVATPVPDPGAEPIDVVATDATAQAGRPDWVPGDEVCEVFAVQVGRTGSGAADTLFEQLQEHFPDHSLSVQTMVEPGRVARIGRIRVGRLAVEAGLDRLDLIKNECAELGLATDIPSLALLRARGS